jgi:hypothetical protein
MEEVEVVFLLFGLLFVFVEDVLKELELEKVEAFFGEGNVYYLLGVVAVVGPLEGEGFCAAIEGESVVTVVAVVRTYFLQFA